MPGTLTISTLSDGTNSTSATNCIQGSAKAWVKFAGGNGNTAGTISASYNVSSITVGGTGAYTVNLTNALTDANYAVEMSAYGNGLICAKGPDAGGYTTTAVPVSTFNTSFAAANAVFVWVAVFR